MNLFFLDKDPLLAASYHCDKHVVKMIVETAQMLSTAHNILSSAEYKKDIDPENILYKTTHVNHPMSVWVRTSPLNYSFAFFLLRELTFEYTRRYNKSHKVERSGLIYVLAYFPEQLNLKEHLSINEKITFPPLCMPDEYKIEDDFVQSYRNYYIGEKSKFAKWKYTKEPEWFRKK